MALFQRTILLFSAIASIECSYYYYASSPNNYYTSFSASPATYLHPPYSLFAPRLSRPVYYVRPLSRTAARPTLKLARSYKLRHQAPAEESVTAIILNNETAVPFTLSKASLTTPEFEKNPNATSKEGVGPAIEVIQLSSPADRLRGSSKIPSIVNKGTAGEGKIKIRNGNKGKKTSFEPQVVFSDVHPIYVKPPTDFKPVIYPNRRLDGIQAGDKSISHLSLPPPPSPYPYGFPRGLSSWTLGGPKAVSRGSFWESLSSDEALNLQPEANTILPSSTSLTSANFNDRTKLTYRPMSLPSYVPWFMVPSSASLYSYEMQYPAASPTITILPLPHSSRPIPAAKVKPVITSNGKKPLTIPEKKVSSSSSSSIKTKLPVGLTSWMLGGVRDLSAKHWKMPDLFVDNVSVVEMENSSSSAADGQRRKNSASDPEKDIMMTSDGEYEKVVPVSVVPEGEREEKDVEAGVVFDDDPEFLNANNNINQS